MEAELIISGLCSFINIRDEDRKVIGPSVILVQTENCGAPDCNTMHTDSYDRAGGHMIVRGGLTSNDAINKEAANAGMAHRSHNHIPYIAYNADEVDVNNGTGFLAVPDAPNFRFMLLDGVQMTIEGKPAAKVEIDESYDRCVVQKDHYWPDGPKEYNPAYVPKRGDRPDKSAVKAWFPLNGGKLAAGNMSRCAWAFLDGSNITLCGRYAEEVVYKDFPHHPGSVDIKLHDLKDKNVVVRTLSFVLKKTNGDKVSLFLGNHVEADMASAMRRQQYDVFDPAVSGTHWVFLNQIAASPGPGPLPKPLPIPFPSAISGLGGGTGTGGPCGPGGH